MLLISLPFFILLGTVCGQNWAGTACLVDHHNYFMNVAQQTVGRIEKEIQWSNLKLQDFNSVIDEQLFKWHAQGTVNYTNGFTVAVQKIDVSDIQNIFSTLNVNGVAQTLASVRGLLHFRNLKIGYDVMANLRDSGTQRFTGLYMYSVLSIQYEIRKNVNTNEISVSSRVTSLAQGFRAMEYMPSDSVSEMLSRHFVPSSLWDSFSKWDVDYINPFMLDVAKHTEYPEIRFGDC